MKKLPPLSESQLEIMDVVWDRGQVTVGEVWKQLAGRRKVARNTVLTLMERLAKKGWLRRKADGHVYRYTAAHPRDATLKQLVGRLVDSAFRGSAEGLVMTLLNGRSITAEEANRIRQLIDRARGTRK
ncbi:MAG: BlaI/MecI/CopY family transcriptional regulator [Pirellulales bacterium]